jgi:hypothetical protein
LVTFQPPIPRTSIAWDKVQRQLVVADDKGLGTHVPAHSGGLSGFSTHQDTGTVNLMPPPNANDLARFRKQVCQRSCARADHLAELEDSRG